MNTVYRASARLLDYIWFSLFLFYSLEQLGFGRPLYSLFFLPILFAPFEAFLIFSFRTTLGKAIFGIFYDKRPNLLESFIVAMKKGALLQPLFLPLINIFFSIFYFREWKKIGTKRFDLLTECLPFKKEYTTKKRILVICLAGAVSFASLMPATFIGYMKQVGPYADKSMGIFRPSDWVQFTSKEKDFTALFPEKPKFIEKDFPVPRTDEVLTYKEHADVGANKHSVGSLELPSGWTEKWGPQTVLKGALYILSDKRKIVKKEKSEHENFPAMLYEMRQGDHYILGKLILVENTLFKLEVEDDHIPTDDEKALAHSFFSAFHPL